LEKTGRNVPSIENVPFVSSSSELERVSLIEENEALIYRISILIILSKLSFPSA